MVYCLKKFCILILSIFLFLFFQEKEAEELTKLCDELISKVQRG